MSASAEGARPRLRPLSLGEILDVSIKICLAHWRTLLKAVLIVVVPLQIAGTIINADYTVDSLSLGGDASQTPEEALDELNQYIGGLAVSTLLQLVAVLVATAACLRAIAQAYLGEQTDWRASLSFAFRMSPALLWLTLLYALGLVVAFVLLIVPGVWLYVAWAFALPALLVENRRGRGALGRSFELVKGRWWRTCGVIVVGFLLAGVISTVVQGAFIVGILVGKDNDLLVLVLSAVAGIIGLAITTPFQAALLTVLYFDLRVRKEGFDLELLAQEIGAGVPSDATASPAVVPVLPPVERVDRTSAPFWPPPPGWRPPEDATEPAPEPEAAAGDPPRDEPPSAPGAAGA